MVNPLVLLFALMGVSAVATTTVFRLWKMELIIHTLEGKEVVFFAAGANSPDIWFHKVKPAEEVVEEEDDDPDHILPSRVRNLWK